ncbi:MAG: hypothetical protein HXY48_07670 [Ignavibacteriaceae bacterium]|nr:hypothetical protein [Ignavibacteriaceae bacterium]
MIEKEPSIKERANLSYSEVQKIINELHSKFSSSPISKQNYYIYPFEIKNSMIYDYNIVSTLQKVAENMCYFLGLFIIPRVIFIEEGLDRYNNLNRVFSCESNGTIRSFERERDYAGLFEGSQKITIVNKKGYAIINLLGILAHEITHHFLYQHNIRKLAENENEIFTDIAAAYLGFGHILYPAYKVISYNTDYKEKEDKSYSYVIHERTIGYITPETIMKVVSITCEMKNWNPKELINNFESGYDRATIKSKLFKYRANLFKKKLSNSLNEIKSKRQKTKIQKLLVDLEKIQNKFYEVKKIMSNASLFKNKNISKDDGELLVNLTNDIFALNTEEEIKTNLKIINEVRNNGKELKKEMYIRINKLDEKINIWLKRLNEITK